MSKHRNPTTPLPWHKIRRHLAFLLGQQFPYWLHQTRLELKDIAAEMKERKHGQ